MSYSWKRRSRWMAAGLGAILLVLAFMPDPLPVEKAVAQRGALKVTIDEDGELRAHDRYIIAAPVGGRLMRSALREGDLVTEKQVLALLAPTPLSVREREEQTARVASARALEREAQ